MRKAMAAILSLLMLLSLAACGDKGGGGGGEDGIKEFTAFFAVPGPEINSDNEIQAMIAEITGAKCKENWLTGQTAAEAVGTLIAGGEYPDFVDGSDATQQLYDAGALIAIDEYWDDYPNIKNFWNEQQWDLIRRDDGHVYWIPQFGRVNGADTTTIPDEAFWIQVRVLEWAGYPKIETLDEYFDLIERYQAANPTMDDGTPNIPYTHSLRRLALFLSGESPGVPGRLSQRRLCHRRYQFHENRGLQHHTHSKAVFRQAE